MKAAPSHDDRVGPRSVAAPWTLVCVLLAACSPYDPDLLPEGPGASGGGGAAGMDASTQDGGGDGGQQDGAADACTASGAPELCNRIDDDCDGTIDEGAAAACEQTILNAVTECVPFANGARCVLVDCREGFAKCDGNPANGCEPACNCNPCDDGGTEDGGE